MKKRLISLLMTLMMLILMAPAVTLTADAASAPTQLWVEASDEYGIPARIDVFKQQTGGSNWNPTYTYQLYLPGNADVSSIKLSWNNDATATVNGATYSSGQCPVPPIDTVTKYTFKDGNSTLAEYNLISYQGSPSVTAVFIDVDESDGKPTIAQMDGDADHEVTCSGRIYIDGTWNTMTKIKGRGNATWERADDKRPYNVTLGSKIKFPGINSEKTKKWSFLAEITDHSLLSNRSGFHLANELGIGQDTASADVWMNGEYQGCYTVTPKTDSFVSKGGFMIEQDNYLEKSVAQGGDPQFKLDGMKESSGWTSAYNRITVKKMGDDLLGYDESGEVDESVANIEDVAYNQIQPWLQEAWDAIRADNGFNSKTGKYYTDYIDIESFAKMYLMHEYAKSFDVCAGSILFHRDGMTDDDKLIAGPMWDLDNAMGSTCRNNNLGQADDRTNGDRRRGDGDFIPLVTEYKTSIYKTLSKHQDFMEEVYHQYNKNQDAFNGLPADVEGMIDDISASAKMNHYKVNDLGTDQYTNTHYYSKSQTLGSGKYAQQYLGTTSSRTDWANYAANLKTFITTRTAWFVEKFYDPDDPANCEHTYTSAVTPPTCTEKGFTTYTCTKCGDSYKDDYTDIIAHDYQDPDQDGVFNCAVCGQKLLNVTITCDEGASVTVYETQDLTGAHVDNAESANPRNSDTGMIDCGGDGQVNIVVNLKPCYGLVSVTAEPATSYKNLKTPDDTGVENHYRITKVKGDFTINVTTESKHVYGELIETEDATCTEDGVEAHYICSECGTCFDEEKNETTEEALKIPAKGHTPAVDAAVEPTCTETGKTEGSHCSRCGEVLTPQETVNALGHDWSDWTVTTPATCTEAGEEARTCARCKDTETREVEATGHKPVEDAAVDPTCTETGLTAGSHCSTCGAVLTAQETIPAKGHASVEDAAVEPTCTETGLTVGSHCSTCGEVLTPQETVPALGHDWSEWAVTTPATCTEAGEEARTCARCKEAETREVKALGHTTVEDAAVEPTCTETGLTAGSHCSTCGAVLTPQETVPALGHDWSEWAVTTPATCTEAGEETRTCARCKEAETREVEATGHKPVEDAAVEPTCTKTGLTAGSHCSTCGEVLKPQETVKALGHEMVAVPAAQATCTEAGNSAYWTCDRCHKYFGDKDGASEIPEDSWVIPKLGHDWKFVDFTWTGSAEAGYTAAAANYECGNDSTHKKAVDASVDFATTPADCETAGSKVYSAFVSAESSLDGEAHSDSITVEIAAFGHSWGAPAWEWTGNDDDGYTAANATFTCSNDISHVETVEAAEIEVTTVDATPTEAGSITYKATVAGPDGKDYTDSKVITIPPAGYTFMDPVYTWTGSDEEGYVVDALMECVEDPAQNITDSAEAVLTITTAPSCEDEGAGTYTAAFANTAFETQTMDVVIEALGHDLEHHEARAVTCTAAGWDAYDTCLRCDYTTFAEIPALGHDLEHHDAKAATCTAAGWDAYDACSRCDYTTKVEIPALGHDLAHHDAQAATCTVAGWDAYDTCSRCDYTTYEEIAATGHAYGEYELTKAATASTSGLLTRSCKNCDKKTTKVVAPVLAKGVVASSTSTKISWLKLSNAGRYVVYFASCGRKSTLKKVKTTKTNSELTYTKTGLKKGKYYKFKVVAQRKIGGKWVNISTSYLGHFAAGNLDSTKRYTNVKSITVPKTSVSLATGKTYTVKPKINMVKSGKKVMTESHAKAFRYLTTNKAVATVSSGGKITAKGKGTCKVYVVGVNGVYKAISVTVK